MEQREIKLVKGASFTWTEPVKRGDEIIQISHRLNRGEIKMFPKEVADRLVMNGNGRFQYTGIETGGAKIKCPHCKREFELTPGVRVEKANKQDSELEKEENKEDDTPKKLVCPHCLEYETPVINGNLKAAERKLKIHMASCKYNPDSKKYDPGMQSSESDGNEPKDGPITTEDVNKK